MTAPSAPQIETVLWPEIGMWLSRMRPEWRAMFDITSDRLVWKASPSESFTVARTAREDKPEALAGMHGANVLLVIDEASAVSERVYEVIQGSLTEPNNKLLMISNPTRNSGTFYDSHNKLRDKFHCIHVSHKDSPRVTDAYVDTMRAQYGEESNVFKVRALGEFPTAGDEQVIALELVQAALTRDVDPLFDVQPVWGLDVARFGSDSTALAKRAGNQLIEPVQTWHGLDLMATCGRIVDAYDDCTKFNKPHKIFCDVIGIGSGVVDRLRELDLPVVGINVAEVPINRSRFMRRRDELWWKLREWLERRECRLPSDPNLEAELLGPTYALMSSGKIQVESKDAMKKRGIASPDRADALCLTFADRPRKSERPFGRGYGRQKVLDEKEAQDWIF